MEFLIKCALCGQSVSSECKACPHCGHPAKGKGCSYCSHYGTGGYNDEWSKYCYAAAKGERCMDSKKEEPCIGFNEESRD